MTSYLVSLRSISFGLCVLLPKGWMDQDETWRAGRSRPRPHCVRWEPSSPHRKGHSSSPLSKFTGAGFTCIRVIRGPCLLWPNGWKNQDAIWYGGRPRPRPHCVWWRPSSPPSKKRGHSNNNNNNRFTALCPGQPGWAGTRRNTHPPTILIIIHSNVLVPCAWQCFCTTSFHVLFGLPLGLEPSTSYSIHFFTQSVSSFRSTCPYHRNLFAVVSVLYHLFLVFLSTPYLECRIPCQLVLLANLSCNLFFILSEICYAWNNYKDIKFQFDLNRTLL